MNLPNTAKDKEEFRDRKRRIIVTEIRPETPVLSHFNFGALSAASPTWTGPPVR